MAIAMLSSSAGAATPGNFTANASGGFVSLSALNLLDLAGGGSTATATASTPAGGSVTGTDSASGTGLCVALGTGPASQTNPCPTSGSAASADVINTTQTANASSAGPLSDTPAPKCLVPPLSILVVTLSVACGSASASEDANGNPTANGTGQLANVTVGLGNTALPTAGLLGNGTLCSSSNSSSVGEAVAGTSGAPATSILTGLLGTVNGILGSVTGATQLTGTTTNPADATSTDPLDSVCGLLGGLVSSLSSVPVVGSLVSSLVGTLSNASASTTLLSITVGQGTSGISSQVATAASGSGTTAIAAGDDLVTSTATTEAVEINLLGMLDIKVLPNTASITIDTTTGYVTSASAPAPGLLSVQEGSGVPTIISLPVLTNLLQQVLSTLNLGGLLNDLLNPQQNVILGASTSGVGTTNGSAQTADLQLDLGSSLLIVNLGDAQVSASSTPAATPAVVTSPGVTPPVVTSPAVAPVTAAAVAPAAVVPGVTTVHTGEFWAGTLPIYLVSGMGLAGIVLIARRRLFSAAHALMPFAHRTASGLVGGPPPGPASGTSSVPPPVSGPARRQPPL